MSMPFRTAESGRFRISRTTRLSIFIKENNYSTMSRAERGSTRNMICERKLIEELSIGMIPYIATEVR